MLGRNKKGQSKLLPWMENISLMEQGTVLAGLRGNDIVRAPHTKKVIRLLRCNLLQNGNPENDFMTPPDMNDLPTGDELFEELEYMTLHYVAHFIHALEVVGYRHPDPKIASICIDYYARLVNGLHLKPEGNAAMTKRLSGEPGTTHDIHPWVKREVGVEQALCPECLEIECECEALRIEAEAAALDEQRRREVAAVANRYGNSGRSGY